MRRSLALVLLLSLLAAPALAKKKEAAKPEDDSPMVISTFAGLALRGIGPAVTSGRITEFAVHP